MAVVAVAVVAAMVAAAMVGAFSRKLDRGIG